jgi:hypothetical protein
MGQWQISGQMASDRGAQIDLAVASEQLNYTDHGSTTEILDGGRGSIGTDYDADVPLGSCAVPALNIRVRFNGTDLPRELSRINLDGAARHCPSQRTRT